MNREEIEKLIDDDIITAFTVMDRLDWRGYKGAYNDLKQEWVDPSQGSNKSSLRNRIKTLLGLYFNRELQPNFSDTRLLTPPPFIPELFLGRDSDIESVYNKLFHEENLLLIVNGQGGIGKTTLAAKYWERYKNHYSHVAWVFAGEDLAQALLALASKLKLSFPETMPSAERLPLLIQELSALNKPCLLIIDNANDLTELEKHYLALRSCANFHILLTSRITEFEQAARHAIQPLGQNVAIELFQRHYSKYQAKEEALLLQILSAVGYNTLVIELLAKNLRNLNKLRQQYSLEQLLQDLQSKGLLGIRQSGSVNISYKTQGPALRQATPEAIISAMYELGELTDEEKQLLSVFAVLPAERIELSMLELLLLDIPLDEPLYHLAQLGWLDFEEQDVSFKISPVVQQIVRERNKERLKADCQGLIDSLQVHLRWEGGGHFADYLVAAKLTDYSTAVIHCFQELDNDIGILCERVGMYYQVTGNLSAALFYFEQYHNFEKCRFEANPQIAYYQRVLAISCERLGETHSALGNLHQALILFDNETKLFKELNASYPEHVGYKESLAISYLKLGDIYSALEHFHQALSLFEDETKLFEELNASHSEHVGYKEGLAVSYEKLGSTHIALGNLAQAFSFFKKNKTLCEELYLLHPNNVSFKYGLAISFQRLGMINLLLHEIEKSEIEYKSYYLICKELYTSEPNYIDFDSNYTESNAIIAALHKIKGIPAKEELAIAQKHFDVLYQKSKREDFQRKSILIAQMQGAEGDSLRELIITFSKF